MTLTVNVWLGMITGLFISKTILTFLAACSVTLKIHRAHYYLSLCCYAN